MELPTARLPPRCLKSKPPRVPPSTKWGSRLRLRRRLSKEKRSRLSVTRGISKWTWKWSPRKRLASVLWRSKECFFKDRATATEIILQTEKVLDMDVATAIGHGTRDAAKAVGEGVKRVVKSAADDEW